MHLRKTQNERQENGVCGETEGLKEGESLSVVEEEKERIKERNGEFQLKKRS